MPMGAPVQSIFNTMGKETIRRLAQSDTPSAVEVPNTWAGLMIWAVGRFGVGMLLAAASLYGLNIVYGDNKNLINRQMEAFREQTKVNAQTLVALDQIRSELHEAHTRALLDYSPGAGRTTSIKPK